MSDTIGVLGGSFNPPTNAHRKIAALVANIFDLVLIAPCGIRSDKSIDLITIDHRIKLVELGFHNLSANVRLMLDDITSANFTPTWQLQEKLSGLGEIWHIIGSDLVCNGSRGQSEIQLCWQRGREIWEQLNFMVITRPGCPVSSTDLPPHCKLLTVEFIGSSTEVRQRLRAGQPITDLVNEAVASYIAEHQLFQLSQEIKNV
jgi:nicotinate-nucleotide adenylyltransferase